MSWLRWWDGTVTDPKWRVVAARSGQPVGSVIAVWAYLLESAREHDGALPDVDPEIIGAALGYEPDAVISIIDGMKAKGSVDDDGIVNWRKRQPKREDDSRARVAAHRARAAEKSVTKQRDNACNAHVTHRNAPEAEAEAEAEAEEKTDIDRPSDARRERDAPSRLPAGHGRVDLSDAKCWEQVEVRLAQIPESRLIADAFTGPMIKLAADFDLETEIIPTLAAELRRPGGSSVRTWALMATRVRERVTADRAATARGNLPQIRGSPTENPLVVIGRQAMQEIKAARN